MNNKSSNDWYKHGFATVAICVVLSIAISQLDLFSNFNEAWIDREIRNTGITGALYFFIIGSFVMAIGAPRQLVAFLGGYAFGSALGFLLSTIAAITACMISFFISKLLFRRLILQRFTKQARQVDQFLFRSPTLKTIIIRLFPVGSNFLTNLVAGTTSVRPSAFFLGSGIGYMPQMIVFALLGKGLFIGSEWKIALSIILLLTSSFLSFRLYKNYRIDLINQKQANDSSIHSQTKV